MAVFTVCTASLAAPAAVQPSLVMLRRANILHEPPSTRILLYPFLGLLLKIRIVVFKIVRNTGLHSVVRLWL